jgi:MinD-like ATPase involved in chromosome partitioning or flagellar assembly
VKHVQVFVNCADEAAGESVCARIERACQHFLGIEVENAGYLPRDRAVAEAACARQPFAVESSNPQARLIDGLAERLLAQMAPQQIADAVACVQ